MDEQTLKEACKAHYGIDTEAAPGSLFAIPGSELAGEAGMRRLLDAYGPLIKALDAQVPASYFCGSLALLGMGLQTAVSDANRAIDLSLANLTVEIRLYDGRYPVIGYRVATWLAEEGPSEAGQRATWLELVYARLYAEVIRPLIEAAAAVSGASPGSLWGQLPSRYQYYMDAWKGGLRPDESRRRDRIDEDFAFFVRELPADVFGRKRHPFDVKIKPIPSLADPCGTTVVGSACCLYYRTEGGDYCYTCPKLKDEERAARRAAYQAERAVRA